MMSKYVWTCCFLFWQISLTAGDIFHERIISFEEDELMTGWHTENLSGQEEHTIHRDSFLYRHGISSLQWDWQAGDRLILNHPIGFIKADPTGKDTYLSTFVVWIYNEIPMEDHLTFRFGKGDRVDCSFDFGLQFKGWRAAWVCFERDMQGKPQPDMDRMTILSPSSRPHGTFYLDHIILSTLSDSRYQTPDFQAPFVNAHTQSHWLSLLKYSKEKPDGKEFHPVTTSEKEDIARLEKRFFEDICEKKIVVSEQTIDSLRRSVDRYHIRIKDGKVSGDPIWFVRFTEVYERFAPEWSHWYDKSTQSLDKYFDLMLQVACAYHQATGSVQKQQLQILFMRLYLHIEEQGIAAGSGLGTIHHSGYSFRSFYPALYLMREILEENDKRESAVQAMQWFAATGEIFIRPDQPGIDMDAFNTTAPGRLASILMMKDSPEKVAYLRYFVRWADNGLQPSRGLMDAFKIDGAVYHHCNNYPAYGIGGIAGASHLIYFFSGTDFRFSEKGHQTLKNAMQIMRFYCNTQEWPVSISGRHPKGTEKLIPESYALMALSGTPDGHKPIDEEMARTYLRLTKYDRKSSLYRTRFLSMGFTPEEDPQGNITVNYACLNVHRRDYWMAAAHGFSRYLWADEHYIGANLYGRYLSYGSLFILTGKWDALITNETSGFQQKGWDWNRIPGTTAIHLPLDQLKADILNVDTHSGYEEMLYSDEAFAGGLSQEENNGLFAMKLHEHDKYNGSLRARKSIFFFNGMIVCLGSDIENTVSGYPTRTTLYQKALNSPADTTWKDEEKLFSLAESTCQTTGNYLIDNIRTGYYVPGGQQLTLSRQKQYSRDQASDEPTEGLFASAWIEHGPAPSGASYEYSVFPETTPEYMQSVASRMKNRETAMYEILRKDNQAHIVRDPETKTTAYVLFEPEQSFENQLVGKVDSACLMMVRETEQGCVVSLCDPDLRLYQGPSDEAYDEAGKRVERSIYSRPWIDHESIPSKIRVTIKGKWNIKETDYCKLISSDPNDTVLEFFCQDGLSREVECIRL